MKYDKLSICEFKMHFMRGFGTLTLQHIKGSWLWKQTNIVWRFVPKSHSTIFRFDLNNYTHMKTLPGIKFYRYLKCYQRFNKKYKGSGICNKKRDTGFFFCKFSLFSYWEKFEAFVPDLVMPYPIRWHILSKSEEAAWKNCP